MSERYHRNWFTRLVVGFFDEVVLLLGPMILFFTKLMLILFWAAVGLVTGPFSLGALLVPFAGGTLDWLVTDPLLLICHGITVMTIVLTFFHMWLRRFVMSRMPEGSYLIV
ncbi:MAG: hypothetical protein AB7P21_30065 [Lautropia sp.]